VEVWLHAFFDLDTRWRRVVSFTPQPLYTRKRAPGTHWIGWVGLRADVDEVVKRKILSPYRDSNPLSFSPFLSTIPLSYPIFL
jgi:hypothetical protein